MECKTCDGTGEVLKVWDDDDFEDYLNDLYPEVNICGMSMQQGRILREMDETAFNCARNETEEYEPCDDCNGTGEEE